MTKREKLEAEARAFFADPAHFTPRAGPEALPPQVLAEALEVLVKRYATARYQHGPCAPFDAYADPVAPGWRTRSGMCRCTAAKVCRYCRDEGHKVPNARRVLAESAA